MHLQNASSGIIKGARFCTLTQAVLYTDTGGGEYRLGARVAEPLYVWLQGKPAAIKNALNVIIRKIAFLIVHD